MSWTSQLSELLLADVDLLTERLLERVVRDVPGVGSIDVAPDMGLSVVRANLEAFAGWLWAASDDAGVEVPWAAVAHARRQARAGIDVTELLRAYRLGQGWLFEQLAACARDHVRDREAAATFVAECGRLSFGYVDAVCTRIAAEHAGELALMARGDLARRAQVIRALLSGERIGTLEAERTLGYRLDGPHICLLAWRLVPDRSAQSRHSLQRVADQAARAFGARASLWLSEHDDLLAGWITVREAGPLDFERLEALIEREPVAVAMSRRVRGPNGFREARRQADRVREIVLASPSAGFGRLVRYEEISLVSLLYDDPEAARTFVADELDGLAVDDAATAGLRETLLSFVRTGSISRTAQGMEVHRNTVAQRVRRAERLLGHPLSERRIEVEAALMLCERLGPNVLAG